MKKKRNNKGFSLVELIVVMAIMAILAVTLAPRLMHYVEKSRKASDQQVINTILDACVLSMADESLRNDFASITSDSYTLNLSADTDTGEGKDNSFYKTNGKTWTVNTSNTLATKLIFDEMKTVVGDFSLKSTDAGADTTITISYVSTNDKVTVILDYDYNDSDTSDQYKVSSR